ncbi:hypothetical protein HUJ05_011128 [Dendroctonus ponderosae]|nr:hypothetical protein HUJ05_011128 [Dendroctonus ponderosae]
MSPNLNRTVPVWFGTRHFVTFMLFLGMANAYVMRTNMSVAIVAMVNHSAIGADSDTTAKGVDVECGFTAQNASAAAASDGEFVWETDLQGYILSSFFYGYVITQIPFGILAKKYGNIYFLGVGMLINSVFGLLVPVAAHFGIWWLVIVRFIQGLGEVSEPKLWKPVLASPTRAVVPRPARVVRSLSHTRPVVGPRVASLVGVGVCDVARAQDGAGLRSATILVGPGPFGYTPWKAALPSILNPALSLWALTLFAHLRARPQSGTLATPVCGEVNGSRSWRLQWAQSCPDRPGCCAPCPTHAPWQSRMSPHWSESVFALLPGDQGGIGL